MICPAACPAKTPSRGCSGCSTRSAFAGSFAQVLDGLGEAGPGVIAIDGKTMRRSFDRAAKRSALHVVPAFAAGTRMVIGQVAAGDKESEIMAAHTLPGLLDLKGARVTGDALHCQGKPRGLSPSAAQTGYLH